MNGYTKLFGSIVASTVWRCDDSTRLVWITMLAMKNRDHIVEASIPGLADLARVSVKSCRAALSKLSAPDPDSRTSEFEGRRIEPIDGGWRIINGEKYRQKMNADERREYLRRKQAEWREKKRCQQAVNNCNAPSTKSTHTDADTEADTDTEGEDKKYSRPKKTAGRGASASTPPSFSDSFIAFWNAVPPKGRERSSKKQAFDAWKKQACEANAAAVMRGLAGWKLCEDWQKDSGKYVKAVHRWLSLRQWEEIPAPVNKNPRAWSASETLHGPVGFDIG